MQILFTCTINVMEKYLNKFFVMTISFIFSNSSIFNSINIVKCNNFDKYNLIGFLFSTVYKNNEYLKYFCFCNHICTPKSM